MNIACGALHQISVGVVTGHKLSDATTYHIATTTGCNLNQIELAILIFILCVSETKLEVGLHHKGIVGCTELIVIEIGVIVREQKFVGNALVMGEMFLLADGHRIVTVRSLYAIDGKLCTHDKTLCQYRLLDTGEGH